ncbi:helix-turn-helix transcriptional regulator [Streptomyces sp. NBC_00249]|uniref:helix-turn-helix domain-containing protein n=1 Tax=Streptomyces sp. NBC_00249 TaxID=2975690 RepID=UPI0022542508|nr:helix-turn-helix transcriptional regulator [Streptomyces sp. NBC_00249]MCX5198850.1 helix-turn-helix transcriptional regulator [Streptomyces sp. NBC_00249]
MPPRTTPTYRQARLGAELRRMRTAAGMTADTAAGLLGLDRGKISNIESGVRTLSTERLRVLADGCSCTDEAYLDALAEMAQPRARGWWHEYRGKLPAGLLDIAELEWHATRLYTAQTVHIPGLLQTEDYARAVFGAVLPELPRLEVETRVSHRHARQQVLRGDRPTTYVGYVHEAALRMQFGGRDAARRQLVHLNEQGEREHITLRVLPVELGIFPGAGHALLYAEGPVRSLDTAQVDTAHGPAFMHDPAQLAKYWSHLEWMAKSALSPEASREFIHTIAANL